MPKQPQKLLGFFNSIIVDKWTKAWCFYSFYTWYSYTYNVCFSSTQNFYIHAGIYRLQVKLKSFYAFGARLWNCLHPDRSKLAKGAFKENFMNYFWSIVLGTEDFHVDAQSLKLKFKTNKKIFIVPYSYSMYFVIYFTCNQIS